MDRRAGGHPRAAHDAGLHGAYLQFDGTTEEKNEHRGVGNLFEVKLQAIENMAKVGMKTTLVTTIVNGVNNDGIGAIVDFALGSTSASKRSSPKNGATAKPKASTKQARRPSTAAVDTRSAAGREQFDQSVLEAVRMRPEDERNATTAPPASQADAAEADVRLGAIK